MKNLILTFLLLIPILGISQGKKISALPTASNLTSSFVPIIQDSSGQYVNRKIAGSSLGGTPLANNGLSLSGDTVQLGGNQLYDVTIDGQNNDFTINTSYFTVGSTLGNRSSYIENSSLISSLYSDNSLGSSNIYTDSQTPEPSLRLVTYSNNGNSQGYFSSDSITFSTSPIGTMKTRFKIDSVGNISMPNTKGLSILADGGNLQFGLVDNDDNNPYFRIATAGNNTFNNVFGDTVSVYLESFNDTYYNTASLSPRNFIVSMDSQERLNIDSIGNIRVSANVIDITGGDPSYATKTSELWADENGALLYSQDDFDYSSLDVQPYLIRMFVSGGVSASIDSTGLTINSGRFKEIQDTDVASVAGAITLGLDGNTFEITGTNAITLISNLQWQNGSVVHLIFTSTAVLTDGTANSGTNIGMELAGNANFTGSADDVVTLVLSEVGNVQRWREVSRSVN